MNAISIKPLTRGYLVTGYGPDGIDEGYAEPDSRAAFHRAAALLGIEPASLYAAAMPAPELPPEKAALQEIHAADDPDLGLAHGAAYEPHGSD